MLDFLTKRAGFSIWEAKRYDSQQSPPYYTLLLQNESGNAAVRYTRFKEFGGHTIWLPVMIFYSDSPAGITQAMFESKKDFVLTPDHGRLTSFLKACERREDIETLAAIAADLK